MNQETKELWIKRQDYIDLLLNSKHLIPIEEAEKIYSVGVKGALKAWWMKKLRSEKLRNSLPGSILLKIKRKLRVKLY